jgi:predicted acyltransferase
MMILAATYYLIDLLGYRKGTHFFVVFGMNALFIFFMSGIVAKSLYLIKWQQGEESITLGGWLYQTIFQPLFSNPKNDSLAYAIVNVLFFWLLGYILYRKKIFIKV